MTVLLLARTAAVTVATGAVLLTGLAVAGAASAGTQTDSPRGFETPPASATAIMSAPKITVPHGRKIG